MDEKIPSQQTGGHSDTRSEVKFNTEEEAAKHFETVKKRFLNVNGWEKFAGEAKAEFALCSSDGEVRYAEPEVNNYIRIKIPGPHNPTGEGFDWVKIEAVEKEKSTGFESIYIRVRPAENPTAPHEKTAHFFDEKATSNFLIKRERNTVAAEVHGRNEVPNTDEDLSLVEKIRNGLVAIGGIIAGSKFQWKSLTEGLIKHEK